MSKNPENKQKVTFEPIAIVGQSCILPGVLNPDELWEAVVAGKDLVSEVDRDYWQMNPKQVRSHGPNYQQDHSWSEAGGYVRGFDKVFDPNGFHVPAKEIEALDPLFQWTLHGVREALSTAGMQQKAAQTAKTGLILGNLNYPSPSQTRYTEKTWLENDSFLNGKAAEVAGLAETDAQNRFSSGLPAQYAAKALGLGGNAYTLDAACASSFYAIKLACDQLHDGNADLMVAGAINRADDLFIHVGFCALSAMSRGGKPRPFDQGADGLVPAEGAAFVVLKRLKDAVRDGDQIHGVIRGIGLSNDGRSGGFLAPAPEGQLRALREAYTMAGIDPKQVSLLECHATGTPVGDTIEIGSSAKVFENHEGLPIGSLKSNMGHLITVAGTAGLLKVLAAMKAGIRPPSINVDNTLPVIENTPLRVLTKAEPWETNGPKIAGISAFGFGGNNAHLIVEEWQGQAMPEVAKTAKTEPVAIVAMEVSNGKAENLNQFTQQLFSNAGAEACGEVAVDIKGLKFPPKDLGQTLPQQLMIMELARKVSHGLKLPAERTSVFIGMGADTEIARYSARWRLKDWVLKWRSEANLDENWLQAAQEAFTPALQAAGVVGTMPNIPANRINSQMDFQGPSYTVSGEELSGIYALDMAQRALANGEIDAALVGAVDFSCEAAHLKAVAAVRGSQVQGADTAVIFVLKRLSEARADGDQVLAVLNQKQEAQEEVADLRPRFGEAHVAAPLLNMAASVISMANRTMPADFTPDAQPLISDQPRTAAMKMRSFAGQQAELSLSQGDAIPFVNAARAKLYVFAASDKNSLIQALKTGETARKGACRLAFVAKNEAEYASRIERAIKFLGQNSPAGYQSLDPDMFYGDATMSGELGFVFNGAAAAYPGMGRDLLRSVPGLGDLTLERFPFLERYLGWTDPNLDKETASDPFNVLCGSTFMSQIHAVLSKRVLKLKPDAMLGVSSGETNSVFASGAWDDVDQMFDDIYTSGMYTKEIAGEYNAAKRAWKDKGVDEINWVGWRILAPVEEVEAAIEPEEFAHLTMVNSGTDCVIGGQEDNCRRVVEKLKKYPTISLGHDIIAHAPEMLTWRDEWHQIHHRETHDVGDLRFYANAFDGASYRADREKIADALTIQSHQRVDFRKVVENAYADGVRIFVEHGPRGLCAGWIADILGDRPHLAVSFDRPGNSLAQLLRGCAQLTAAGIDLDIDALEALMAYPQSHQPSKTLKFPAHGPVVKLPAAQALAPVKQELKKQPSIGKRMTTEETMPVAPAQPQLLPEGLISHGAQAAPQVAQAQAVAQPVAQPQAAQAPAAVAFTAATDPVIDGMRQFHGMISQAHQQFLQQQTRGMERLMQYRMQMGQMQPGQPIPNMPVTPQPAPVQAQAPVQPATPAPAPPVAKKPAAPVAKPAAPVAKPAAPVAKAETKKEEAKPAATKAKVEKKTQPAVLPGPKYSREQLEILASGKISEVLGPLFERQDHFPRQVRMPEPPLLLADRVTGIDAEPGAMGRTATIWTETDITPDAWYLDRNHMPPGIMIESGQADLLLISYLGADFQNKGERVYRLLGCELTFKGGMPTIGDTLKYDIHIDGYAEQGPIRLFFFHYDCCVDDEVRLTVVNGQAGFFTDEELADSGGILWVPEDHTLDPNARVDAPAFEVASSFSAEQVRAFSEGRVVECFGDEFYLTNTHTSTPRILHGRLTFFDEIAEFNPKGGPWGRGYLRAEKLLADDEWFFDGHFKNDPCMPGTLMFDGCFQTMAFYLSALGYTVDRDGWRFEPVPDQKFKLRCRGQVTPGARRLTYEVFVEEVHDGPIPTLYADVLCTVDGLKAFHGERIALHLTPSFPMEGGWTLPEPEHAKTPASIPGMTFDYQSLASCAWGRPSNAFGPRYSIFDDIRRCPRLPGPPYHFMTRITDLSVPMGHMKAGGVVEAEYDIPPDAWYFSENGNRSMPYAVLLEAALQPCGWFASYLGCALEAKEDLYFRNLDGTSTQYVEILPNSGTLRTVVNSTKVVKAGAIIIVGFEVNCYLGETLAYNMETVFGFFNKAALADQAGLPSSDALRAEVVTPGTFKMDLTARPARYFGGELRLPGPMLQLVDRIIDYSPEGGKAGLGRVRAQADVNSKKWYFKSHFYGDSVQPGSLGIEPLLQLLQFYMLHTEMGKGIVNPRFEAIQLNAPMTWRYRGQVTPNRKLVTFDVELTEVKDGDDEATVMAEASLWVDGLRIYETVNLGMRIVSDRVGAVAGCDEVLDPKVDKWLVDHSPTWTVPALPMMSMVDRLANAAKLRQPGREVVGVENVQVHGWLAFQDGPRYLKYEGTPVDNRRVACKLLVWNEKYQRYTTAASGDVILDATRPLPLKPTKPLADAVEVANPYESGTLFHGPAFQALTSLKMGATGSSSILNASPGEIPLGALNQKLLDAATHGIPHDNLNQWCDEIPEGMVAYPKSLTKAVFYRMPPTEGEVRCEARFKGFENGDKRFPCFDLELIYDDIVWAEISMVEALFPKGKLGMADAEQRRAFLTGNYVPGLSLSDFDGTTSRLSEQDVQASDWLAGTMDATYDLEKLEISEQTRQIVAKEHIARVAETHPRHVSFDDAGSISCDAAPLLKFCCVTSEEDKTWTVKDEVPAQISFLKVQEYWRKQLNTEAWLGEDVFQGLTELFLKTVKLHDPKGFEQLKGNGVLFVGNHQTGVESLLFSVVLSTLLEVNVPVFAKETHRDSWIGRMISALFAAPGLTAPELLILVNREDPAQLLAAMNKTFAGIQGNEHALLVHTHGTRSQKAQDPVSVVSSSLIDMAVSHGVAVVPVRFVGGLPVEEMDHKIEFPIGYGKQTIHVGAAIGAAELKSKSSGERKAQVIEAINQLSDWANEEPAPANPALAEKIANQQKESSEIQAVLHTALTQLEDPCEDSQKLFAIFKGETKVDPKDARSEWLGNCVDELLGPTPVTK